MGALVALAIHPLGITTGLLAKKGREITGVNDYSVQQAAYDLKKFRSKGIVIFDFDGSCFSTFTESGRQK